jgi:hypothetical protein
MPKLQQQLRGRRKQRKGSSKDSSSSRSSSVKDAASASPSPGLIGGESKVDEGLGSERAAGDSCFFLPSMCCADAHAVQLSLPCGA